MWIGIDSGDFSTYEGETAYGYRLFPSPILIPAVIATINQDPSTLIGQHDLYSFEFIFREDAFDLAHRVRKGRFYKKHNQQPFQWKIRSHPIFDKSGQNFIDKNLATFITFSLWHGLLSKETEQPLIILGAKERFSIWSIVNLEATAMNEEIVVLKSRQSFGALPELIRDKIPEDRRLKIIEMIDKVKEEIYRAGPESVIDRCRDAASAILGAYLEDQNVAKYEDDLDNLIKKFQNAKNPRRIAINSADTIRILHARAKPSVQEAKKPPSITEQDAELAIQCLGSILYELEWGKWY